MVAPARRKGRVAPRFCCDRWWWYKARSTPRFRDLWGVTKRRPSTEGGAFSLGGGGFPLLCCGALRAAIGRAVFQPPINRCLPPEIRRVRAVTSLPVGSRKFVVFDQAVDVLSAIRDAFDFVQIGPGQHP